MKRLGTMLLSCVVAMLWIAGSATADDDDSKVTNVNVTKYEFEAPVRVTAGGEFVAVEAPGYACPTMADVDGDGLDDLVVGQFRNGNMQFCKNIGSAGKQPEFSKPEWLMTGEDRAIVPGVW